MDEFSYYVEVGDFAFPIGSFEEALDFQELLKQHDLKVDILKMRR